MRIARKLQSLTAVLLLTGTVFAQTEKGATPSFYRLEFVTKELDENKVVNSRTYSMIVGDKEGDQNSIRTGTRLPVVTSSGPGSSQFTYLDIGVRIDCRNVKEISGQLALWISADISSPGSEPGATSGAPPAVRQYTWSSMAIVPLKKPTMVYSSDDLASKHKFQLEVTATKL